MKVNINYVFCTDVCCINVAELGFRVKHFKHGNEASIYMKLEIFWPDQ
jgi:hypothetical protein